MKKLFLLIIITNSIMIFAQNLEITSSGKTFFSISTPNENWLIVEQENQFEIYAENFQLIDTFELNIQNEQYYWIYVASRDFDDDDNIEVLYQYNDNDYYSSIILKDITTGENQVVYEGNPYYYYCTAYGYLGGERVFSISRMNSDYIYDASYTYRSGVQTFSQNVNIMQTDINLNQNYPNPFNPSTTISFSLTTEDTQIQSFFLTGQAENTELIIYNIKGQKVKTFSNLQINKLSNNQILWDGTNDQGQKVPSGPYFYKVKIGLQEQTKRMILLK